MTAPPSAEEVAEIALGMTYQMQAAITWPKKPRLFPTMLYSATINALIRRGLVDAGSYDLTPLGLAVRNHLIGETR